MSTLPAHSGDMRLVQHCHFRPEESVRRRVCIVYCVGCLTASMASTQPMLLVLPTMSSEIALCFLGAKIPENQWPVGTILDSVDMEHCHRQQFSRIILTKV